MINYRQLCAILKLVNDFLYTGSWGWRYQGSFNIRKDQVVYVNENSVTSFVIPCIANKPTVKDTILKKEETVGLHQQFYTGICMYIVLNYELGHRGRETGRKFCWVQSKVRPIPRIYSELYEA